MAEETLAAFLSTYDPEGTKVVADITVERGSNDESQFIILRHEGYVMVLNPMPFDDHLCLDVHSFVDGKDARAGVMGMDAESRTGRVTFSEADTAGTSHGWPAASLVAVLLGEQSHG